MDGRTDGWINGRTDGWTDGWINGLTDGRMDKWMDPINYSELNRYAMLQKVVPHMRTHTCRISTVYGN